MLIEWDKIAEYQDGKLFWKINTFSGRYHDKPAAIAGKEMGSIKNGGYWHFSYRRKWYLRHVIVWILHNGPIPDGFVVDHIKSVQDTGGIADDRIENLQLLTIATNSRKGGGASANKTNKSSKRRGVSIDSRYPGKPWRARMKIKDKVLCLNFATEKEAITQREEWEKIYCGEDYDKETSGVSS